MKRISFSFLVLACGIFVGSGLARAATLIPRSKTVQSKVATKPVGQKTLEMVFVLDTTGSMSGLLEGAKQRIWGIVNDVMRQDSHPAVRVGLVAYRDHGDTYVTQVLPLTEDLDKVYSTLMDYRADGGGDTPEDVRAAMSDALSKTGWRQDNSQTAQVMFLVGDAPPHDDYPNEPDTAVTASKAISRGIIVNTIQCGAMTETTPVWEQIAQRGQGRYFAIPQDGGVQVITTPYDAKLTELGNKLGQTYLAYGGGDGPAGDKYRLDQTTAQGAMESKVITAGASAPNADRAINKAVNAEAYVGDLLQSIENGTVKLEDVKTEDLPSDLKKLDPAARKKEVEKRLAARKAIRDEILTIGKQRTEYIAAEQRKQTGANKNGFDLAVSEALKTQLAAKGIK
jgi:Mg-chelatase subunit ChlD